MVTSYIFTKGMVLVTHYKVFVPSNALLLSNLLPTEGEICLTIYVSN